MVARWSHAARSSADADAASNPTQCADLRPRRVARHLASVLTLAAVCAAPEPAAAQSSLGARIEAVRDGTVRVTTPAREGV